MRKSKCQGIDALALQHGDANDRRWCDARVTSRILLIIDCSVISIFHNLLLL